MTLLKTPLYKISGAGNTFILVDASAASSWLETETSTGLNRAELVKLLCGSTYGMQTDGMLFLSEGQQGVDYIWDFYNSDGSHAEMCGNAARCAARFCYDVIEGKKRSEFVFKTGAGIVKAKYLSSGLVQVAMPEIHLFEKTKEFSILGHTKNVTIVNTGVPHAVVQIDSLKEAESLKDFARALRNNSYFGAAGSNVTFYAKGESVAAPIDAITFERGVEDYTLACGTGAVAAAYVFHLDHGKDLVEVRMPGGLLAVGLAGPDHRSATLEGDAIIVSEFKISKEVFS